jgi:hypothetical protein
MGVTCRSDFHESDGGELTRFLRHVRECEAFRQRPSWDAYERHKAAFQRNFPEASSDEYEAAMSAITRICGV